MTPDQIINAACRLSDRKNVDVFLYNGEISRSYSLEFMNMIHKVESNNQEALLFLTTHGGEPDAAYKMSRYLQHKYHKHTIVISGLCKSAGTLLAIGANEIAFSPYGELGPLDVQLIKQDNLAERQSGLTIQEALDVLTVTAVKKHGLVFGSIMNATNSIVSFPTAAKASAELINGLFSPIFAQIDPYEVGDKLRAMRIAEEYGKRLSANTGNLKDKALNTLTRTYPSHSFVIDYTEAQDLFQNVRLIDEDEIEAVMALGSLAREEVNSKPVMLCLSNSGNDQDEKTSGNVDAEKEGSAQSVATNSNGSIKKRNISKKSPRSKRTSAMAIPNGKEAQNQ